MAAAAAAACRRVVSYTLLGPPAESLRAAAKAAAPATGDMFLDLLDANFNKENLQPAKGLTENASPTFVTSGDPCLDFFFHVVPGTPASSVTSLLASAWSAEPVTALRLACNLRGVRGTGKSDREGFYAAALWMHGCHPATLALNARPIADFGYLKDLPEILHRIIHGGVSTRTPGKKARLAASGGGFVARGGAGFRGARGGRRRFLGSRHARSTGRTGKKPRHLGTREARVAAANERDRKIAAEAAVERRKRRAEASARAVDRYSRDPTYRQLHDCTAELFADLLAEDMKKLADGKVNKISLAAKWCPSVDSCYDRSTLICEAIARRLFPKGSSSELPEDLEDEYYAYRVRKLLHKAALVPLRRALELPEIFISANAWGDVVYPRVASVAMNNYKEFFLKHDAERFGLYLADVKTDKVKIAAGTLLPHEMLESFGDEVAALQWERMVSDVRALGKLNNCIPVCDVSSSMSGLPMDVCIALGLLISELSEEPWHHRVITFSERPEIHHITGNTLWEKSNFIRYMHWGYNTNFQAVFDKILSVAVAGKLPPERMVKKVFVFSDMEFDKASPNPWETDYEAITRKFTEAGYGEAIPEIVFWNLRDSRSVPVTSEQKGVALVSGYSKNMIKLFLDGEEVVPDKIPTPREVMDKAISGPEYEKLAVFD
ncbi:uncharacterized protein LOC120671399 [Panicum virgatum]|uniref:Uncharacterized protein n=1 Tax=Panicum virgatum TaxID=38727 RepID=A0A8T0T9F0_PANVG|nr:uncharacterized protein LOC120671399 [Panicum virgatum]KAG2607620.1 hypothetical protein PVAP13_4NG262000 [Panicum virgatum]